jgi:hypothetical protein
VRELQYKHVSTVLALHKKPTQLHSAKFHRVHKEINPLCAPGFDGAGFATPDPGDAPPMAGFNIMIACYINRMKTGS